VEFYDEAKVEDAFDQAAKDVSEEETEEPEAVELEYFG
jgi:hypothetical protein